MDYDELSNSKKLSWNFIHIYNFITVAWATFFYGKLALYSVDYFLRLGAIPIEKHRATICILNNNKERCLRQEHLLDNAIASKNVFATGISNFGDNYLARAGLKKFPAIEVDEIYFSYKGEHKEYTYVMLCGFLDMIIQKSIISSL